MRRGKYAHIWDDEDKIRTVVETCNSRAEILRQLGVTVNNGMYRQLESVCAQYGVDLPTREHALKFNAQTTRDKILAKRDLNVIFSKRNKTYSGSYLRDILVRDLKWAYVCMMPNCPSPLPEWRGEKLVIQLDHIDGDKFNNQLENLRFLCPNCHTQTSTYGNKQPTHNRYSYCSCGRRMSTTSKHCQKCANEELRQKRLASSDYTDTHYPSEDILLSMVLTSGYESVGRELGVTGVAVKKYLLRRGHKIVQKDGTRTHIKLNDNV